MQSHIASTIIRVPSRFGHPPTWNLHTCCNFTLFDVIKISLEVYHVEVGDAVVDHSFAPNAFRWRTLSNLQSSSTIDTVVYFRASRYYSSCFFKISIRVWLQRNPFRQVLDQLLLIWKTAIMTHNHYSTMIQGDQAITKKIEETGHSWEWTYSCCCWMLVCCSWWGYRKPESSCQVPKARRKFYYRTMVSKYAC